MSQRIQAVRGMNDLLPEQLALWQRVEAIMRRVISGYGYREIRTPIIERAPLFERSIGEVTDIIEKEIYRFDDRSGESLALRPEGTAGCVRAGIEHGLLYNQEQRFWYIGPMFRYERPQKGRYRQFHQCGVEVFGLSGPDIDAELILLTAQLWRALGIDQQLQLQLNTIGTAAARVTYQKALVAYLSQYQHQLDAESQRRLQTNPLRLLDSKNESVQALIAKAPQLADYLDSATQTHFTGLCALLDAVQIPYQINVHLVRGLDYYTGTVFEWITDHLGAQNTVCGGGRYDGMVALLGGQDTPAIGFSIGLERLLLLIAQINPQLMRPDFVEVYLVSSGQGTLAAALCLADRIRIGLPHWRVITHLGGGDFKKQFRRADKIGAQVVLVLGETELATQQVVVKQLRTGTTQTVAQSAVIDYLQQCFKQ